MKKLALTTLTLLIYLKLSAQTGYFAIRYNYMKIVTPQDTTSVNMQNWFYFNDCSLVISSFSARVYDILIPSVKAYDASGIRVLNDTGQKLEDGGVIYESPIHNKQVAVYFTNEMKQLEILRKDKTGIIFY